MDYGVNENRVFTPRIFKNPKVTRKKIARCDKTSRSGKTVHRGLIIEAYQSSYEL